MLGRSSEAGGSPSWDTPRNNPWNSGAENTPHHHKPLTLSNSLPLWLTLPYVQSYPAQKCQLSDFHTVSVRGEFWHTGQSTRPSSLPDVTLATAASDAGIMRQNQMHFGGSQQKLFPLILRCYGLILDCVKCPYRPSYYEQCRAQMTSHTMWQWSCRSGYGVIYQRLRSEIYRLVKQHGNIIHIYTNTSEVMKSKGRKWQPLRARTHYSLLCLTNHLLLSGKVIQRKSHHFTTTVNNGVTLKSLRLQIKGECVEFPGY